MVGNLKLEDIWESVNDISLFFFEGVYKGFYIESLPPIPTQQPLKPTTNPNLATINPNLEITKTTTSKWPATNPNPVTTET